MSASPDRLGLLGCAALAVWTFVYWTSIAPPQHSRRERVEHLDRPADSGAPRADRGARAPEVAAGVTRPDQDTVRDATPTAPRDNPAPPETPDPQTSWPSRADASTTHTVVAGDTLAALAARYLGSEAHAGRIFEANRDVLRDPNVLQVGQVLKIPTQ